MLQDTLSWDLVLDIMASLSSVCVLRFGGRVCQSIQPHQIRVLCDIVQRKQISNITETVCRNHILLRGRCTRHVLSPFNLGLLPSPHVAMAHGGSWQGGRSTSSDHTNHADNGKQVKRKKRGRIDIPGDARLTIDQWRMMKQGWIDERKQLKRPYLPRSDFEFELCAMEEIAVQGFTVTGNSFLEYLREGCISLNYQIISKCLFMSLACREVDGILWCIEWLNKNQGMMDKGTIANAVSGLCLTDRWRESLHFVSRADEIKSVTARILEPIFIAACNHGDLELAKDIISDHYRRDLVPSEACCLKLLSVFHCRKANKQSREESEEMVRRLMDFMREKRHFPMQSVATEIGTWFKSKSHEKWRVEHTSISHDGICQSCQGHLESLTVDQAEFSQLKEEIFKKVIRGKDIYKKSTPEELEAFMAFVGDAPGYDIVVDGLNVANIKKQRPPGKVLRAFVVHLVKECGYKCLVLGRHHMLKKDHQYDEQDMAAIQDLADCFFTQNMSEDDPFMLYAAMHSGSGARYISRDMLRDHRALLSPAAHHTFVKWQRTRQLIPVDVVRGRPVFKKNLMYDTVVQSTDTTWHLPYDDGQPRFSYEVPLNWLCVARC